MRLSVILLALLVSSVPSHLVAQTGPSVAASSPLLSDTLPPVRPGVRLFSRTALGSVGWVTGAAALGLGAYYLLPGCSGCEDPGAEQMIWGATLGGVLGASFFAAQLSLRDGCTFAVRFAPSAAASAVGAGLGLLLIRPSNGISLPVLTVTGASLGSLSCSAGRSAA